MKEYLDYKEDNDIDRIVPVVVAGLDYGERKNFEHSMEEMISLVEACDMEAVSVITQSMVHPDPGTYMGKGKIEYIAEVIEEKHAEYCVFEDNLSPAQMKNLQEMVGVPVWDRTNLILEIFSRRAKTLEARLQVESAYLQYMLPRLSGMWQHLGRQGGGGGSRANKGVGETQIELDRRQINQRLTELRRELKQMELTRSTQRSGRKKKGLPLAALVGYTNAGKSTIMNSMLDHSVTQEEKKVLQKDMLFATLDTSVRHIKGDRNRDFLLSDTVGFIENLPHSLVKAFRSTLEEAANADLLLIVIDASDPYAAQHKTVTEDTLRELGAGDIPRLYIMNKADMIEDRSYNIPMMRDDTIWMSAVSEESISKLMEIVSEKLYSGNKICRLVIPYSRGDITDLVHRNGHVISEEYTGEGILIEAELTVKTYGQVKEWDPDWEEPKEEW